MVDGKRVRASRALGTSNKAAAKAKLRALVRREGAPPSAAEAQDEVTVNEYAEPHLRDGDRAHWERIWRPAVGAMALSHVRAADIRTVLDDLAGGSIARHDGQRYSKQSVIHVRALAYRIFDTAMRDELIMRNPVALTKVPDVDDGPVKQRAILTDDEIRQLVQHPHVDREVALLVVLSRCVGGLRSGDLLALDWMAFSPGFETVTFTRRKTRKKRPASECHAIPPTVLPFVHQWHQLHGSPTSGPVFPVRRDHRGKQIGEKRSRASFALRLRRELLKAGVDRHELHHETATTLPCDFHSCRRAYATALARVGVSEQQAMALTGHSSSSVHARYVAALAVRELPTGAVPLLEEPIAAE